MNLSQAERNTTAVLATCEGLVITLEANYRNKTRKKVITRHLEGLQEATDNARNHWGIANAISAADILRVQRHITGWESRVIPSRGHPTLVTSSLLALLDDLSQNLTGRRKELIDKIIAAVTRIHKYYDPRFEYDDTADAALEGVKIWYEELEKVHVSKKEAEDFNKLVTSYGAATIDPGRSRSPVLRIVRKKEKEESNRRILEKIKDQHLTNPMQIAHSG